MTRQIVAAIFIATLACVTPLAAGAQQSRPIKFGIMGGDAYPI
jgi:hypothetical protein